MDLEEDENPVERTHSKHCSNDACHCENCTCGDECSCSFIEQCPCSYRKTPDAV